LLAVGIIESLGACWSKTLNLLQ